MTEKQRYHHGDLRNALLNAALELLAQAGAGGLSIRGVAQKAGVSHAAPAYHFPTLKSLVTALSRIGFELFEKSIADATAKAPSDPASQMQAASDGYISFAQAQPELFRLMFSASASDWTDEALRTSANKARQQLRAICAPASAYLKRESEEAKTQFENLVWSSIHGYAHLVIEGQISGEPGCPSPAPLNISTLIFGPTNVKVTVQLS